MENRRRNPSTFKALICAVVIMSAICGISFADNQLIPVTATVRVAPEGQYAPIITVIDQTVREGDLLDFDILAADSNLTDHVALTISRGQTPWLTILSNNSGNPAKMVVRAAPPTGSAGRYKVSFTATDDSPYLLSSTIDIYINVNPSNRPPVITAQNQAVQIGQLLSFSVNCSDPDNGDTVTLTYSSKPAWLTSSASNPVIGNPINITFTGTPSSSDEGTYTLHLSAGDNGTPQQSASRDVTIIVSRINHPPVLEVIRNKEIPVRVKLEFTISASDPDGDPLTYNASGAAINSGAAFNPSTRTFTWTPTPSQAGSYTVRFEAFDGSLTDYEDIIVYVSGSDAPVFDPLFDKYIKVGGTLNFAVVARDPNNDAIIYGASNLPTGATFDPNTQTFNWTPQAAQEGTYKNVAFTAYDGTYTATKLIYIFVNPSDAPTLDLIGEKYVTAGQTLSFMLKATDPNDKPLTYSVSNKPAGSSLTGPVFTWTPAVGQVGTYRDIVFTASNGIYQDSKICWIFVVSNDAPVIETIGEKHVVEGRTISFAIHATDPNGDPLTYLQPTNAPKGSYFDTGTHLFTWKPVIGERGVYNDVIFSVTDGTNTTKAGTWIFVDANDAPVVDPIPEKHIKAGQLLSFAVTAFDPNGDSLTYKALNIPDGSNFSNQTFRWTPTLSEVGVYDNILFEVSDGTNVVTVRTWIFVEEPGQPVIQTIGEKHILAGQQLAFSIYATDPNGYALTYSASNMPTGASFNPTTHVFTWTPVSNQVGVYPNVAFTVSNGIYSATAVTWIFVKSPNAPTIFVPGEQHIKTGNLLEFTITATDPNINPANLIYTASNLPPGSTFVNQLFQWTPTASQVGTYPNIEFTVSNGTYSDSSVTWIFVEASGAPVFDQHFNAKYGKTGEPMTFSVSATDPDDPTSSLVYTGINLPQGATFTGQTFRWTPQPVQVGSYKDVRLQVTDPHNNMDSLVFWIFISNNTPPVLDPIGIKSGPAGKPFTFNVMASDFDGDPLHFTASNLPSVNAAFTDNGDNTATFRWTNPQAGTYNNVRFEVSDGIAKDTEDATIVITP